MILDEIWHKIELSVMAGDFVPVCPSGQFCPSYPPITGIIMLFGHQNLVIDTPYVKIYVILVKQWYKIYFGNGGTFYPGLPYSYNFDKGTPPPDFLLRWLSLSKKPNYEWSSTKFYFKPFLEIIPHTNRSGIFIRLSGEPGNLNIISTTIW